MTTRPTYFVVLAALLICYAWRSNATTLSPGQDASKVLTVFVSRATRRGSASRRELISGFCV